MAPDVKATAAGVHLHPQVVVQGPYGFDTRSGTVVTVVLNRMLPRRGYRLRVAFRRPRQARSSPRPTISPHQWTNGADTSRRHRPYVTRHRFARTRYYYKRSECSPVTTRAPRSPTASERDARPPLKCRSATSRSISTTFSRAPTRPPVVLRSTRLAKYWFVFRVAASRFNFTLQPCASDAGDDIRDIPLLSEFFSGKPLALTLNHASPPCAYPIGTLQYIGYLLEDPFAYG